MKVALVYDRVNKWGGAERVLLVLHELFPKAPLYTSVYNSRTSKWARVFPKVIPSFLQKMPFAKNNHEVLASLMPIAFESFNFDKYDLVISVTSESAKGIIAKPGTLHICICLTPTRYLWSHYKEYFKNQIFKSISSPMVSYLKTWDKVSSQRPDVMIAISNEVKTRIKKYYKRDSTVIFPTTNLRFNQKKYSPRPGKYFLVVSRLVPYKKVDLVVKAFNEIKKPLIIVGVGVEEKRLKRIAKENIKFVGQVSDAALVKFYQNCKALIFPQEEDFGLTAIEAMSFGKPVIAYKKGGAKDIVIEGITGIFFDKQRKDDLIKGLEVFHKTIFNDRLIRKHAKKFSKEVFKKKLLKIINLYK